jgi:hypothetical protein
MTDVVTGVFGDALTPTQLLIDAMKMTDGAQVLLVVIADKDGDIVTGWSSSNPLERLGMLEVSQAQIIEASFREKDDG